MHEQFLLKALDQAWLGRGICAPNPSVGAVAVRNDKIIAQAWHHGAGTPHAEVLVLEQFPANTPDVTLYVTLEPCNHWGRTPPCVDAIIQHGIQRVVYAYADPNPVVLKNYTPELLKQHDIDVLQITIPQIDRFYQSYQYWVDTKKPWVTVKLAQTLDGKIAGPHGERIQISNAACAAFTHRKRLQSDVILTTSRTLNRDDPLLNARLSEVETAKPIAIIQGQSALRSDLKIFKSAKHCHIYHAPQYQIKAQPNCSYFPVEQINGRLDLSAVIVHLGNLGYHDVWVEAGALLFNALHKAGLVNRTHIYIAPRILGEQALSAYLYPELFNTPHSVHWQTLDNNSVVTLDWHQK